MDHVHFQTKFLCNGLKGAVKHNPAPSLDKDLQATKTFLENKISLSQG